MVDYRVINQDVLNWCSSHKGEKFHALLADPPYELGLMGKSWDKSGISFKPETWAKLAEHLHPGAFGMVFSSARGWHRVAVAIEDAGLILHPSIFGWLRSGFAQSNIVKGIPEFNGHRYGLQSLKPALEPIIVFQKPFTSTPLKEIKLYGAGTLWIEGGRTSSGRWPPNFYLQHSIECEYIGHREIVNKSGGVTGTESSTPAKTVFGKYNREKFSRYGDLSGKEIIEDWNCSSECPISRLDHQVGKRKTVSHYFVNVSLNEADKTFYAPRASHLEREHGLPDKIPCVVCGRLESTHHLNRKDKKEKCYRNNHSTIKPISLTTWMAALLLPPQEYQPRKLLVPFAGVGSEMVGAVKAGWDDVTGIEINSDYTDIAKARVESHIKELNSGQ